jgi:glycine cleavage system T protein (aminomethyltransferase)
MNQVESSALQKTPLHARHVALGARMVPFAGWDMPVEYSGISDEHLAVRTRAGLFDVSHMGEIEVAGADAVAAIQRITCNDAAKLTVGQAQYSGLMTEQGAFVDDLLVYRLADSHFLLVVNASNTEKDFAWIASQMTGDAVAVNSSSRYALVAIQGPAGRDILRTLTGVDLGMKYYWFATGEVAGIRATISRTGYTGEDGYEIFVPPAYAERLWDALIQAGKSADIRPAGLGARDTLRLEAAMRLYGNDIDDTTSVLEADLEWIVSWTKGDFVGRAALEAQKEGGLARRLVGFEMTTERAIARHGHPVLIDGQPVGVVTSGTQTPFLKKAIGMAYVPMGTSEGDEIEIDIRNRRATARVVPMPFYKRPRR